MIAEYMFNGFDGELKDLNGPFGKSGAENHGKPVFSKIGTNQGHKVMMYYWDQRDGDSLHGWWIAPEVGGAHVWAMNPIGSTTPPQSGWKVPWHGRVNPKVTCMPQNKRSNDGASGSTAAKKAKEDDGKSAREIRRDEFEAQTEREQQKFYEDRLKVLKSQAKNLVDTAKKKLADVKGNPNFRTLMADKAEKKLSSEELKKRTAELDRVLTTIIRQIQTSKLATSNKIMEGEAVLKDAKVPITAWPSVKAKLSKYVKICEALLEEATEWKSRKEDKEAVLWNQAADTLVEDLDLVLQQTEKDVDRLKDAARLLAPEFIETLNMKELSESAAATEQAISQATVSVQSASSAITAKIPMFKNASNVAFQKFRVLQLKIPAWNEDIQRLQKLSLEADKKGREILAAEDRTKAERKQKEREKRFERWNQNMIDDGWAEVYVVADLLDIAERDCTRNNAQCALEAMVALEKTVEDFIMKKDASNKTREVLSTTMGNKVRELRARTTECQKKISEEEFEETQNKLMRFSGRFMEYLEANHKSPREIFDFISKNTDQVSVAQVKNWCEITLDITKEEVGCSLDQADCPRPTAKQALTFEEFPLLFHVYFEACEGATLSEECKPESSSEESSEEEDDDDEEQIEVPIGTLVMLCGMPVGNRLPVKAAHGDGRGYLNAARPGWARVSSYYECVGETVLTDSFTMTNTFKLVKRLKIGERLRIIEPPRICEDTGANRLKAQSIVDGKIGYTTIVKPGGQDVLKPYAVTKDAFTDEVFLSDPSLLEGVHCVEGEPIEAIRDDEWTLCHLGKCMGANAFVEVFWSDDSKGRVPRKDIRCRGTATKIRLSQWSLADFVGRIVRKAYDEIKGVNVPALKLTDEKGVILPMHEVRSHGLKIEREAAVASRMLDTMHDLLNEKAQDPALKDQLVKDVYDLSKKYNKLMSSLNQVRHSATVAIQSEINKARVAEQERELVERKKRDREIQEHSEKVVAKGNELIAVLQKLCDHPPMQEARMSDLKRHIGDMEKSERELEQYLDEELAHVKKYPPSPAANALVQNLLNFQKKGRSATNVQVAMAFKNVRKRLEDAHSCAQTNAVAQIRNLVSKVYPNNTMQEAISRLFDRISSPIDKEEKEKDDDDSSSSSEDECQDHVVELKRFEREFFAMSEETLNIVRLLPWPLNKEQFTLSFLSLARIVGVAPVPIMNEVTGVVITTVEQHDLIEVIKTVVRTDEKDEEQVRVCVFGPSQGQRQREGTISAKRIRKLGVKYDVCKETVLTNMAELTQLKVISRLKRGNKVIAVGYPILASKLLRMRARLVDGTEGWLSMVGNNVDFVTPTSWL